MHTDLFFPLLEPVKMKAAARTNAIDQFLCNLRQGKGKTIYN
jgi:hypothetical protein